jgi:hypothetical protein
MAIIYKELNRTRMEDFRIWLINVTISGGPEYHRLNEITFIWCFLPRSQDEGTPRVPRCRSISLGSCRNPSEKKLLFLSSLLPLRHFLSFLVRNLFSIDVDPLAHWSFLNPFSSFCIVSFVGGDVLPTPPPPSSSSYSLVSYASSKPARPPAT